MAVAKRFQEAGLPFECLEARDRVGGLWAYDDRTGPAFRSLHSNTSRFALAYSDFPPPEGFPDFPHHADMARYFEDYVRRFRLGGNIRFNAKVAKAEPGDDGLWRVTLQSGEARVYDALVVANGHAWEPQWPDPPYPGEFTGRQIHARDYRDPSDPVQCKDRDVLIVGFGDSALDIACEIARKDGARRVYLSQRRGQWVLPKYLGGKPFDAAGADRGRSWTAALVPEALWTARMRARVEAEFGRPQDFGLLPPSEPMFAGRAPVSQELYLRLGSGDIAPKPGVRALEGGRVHFVDGSSAPVDVIIWCTGYRIAFPFFDEAVLGAPGNKIALWRKMLDPRFANLFFAGLVRANCAAVAIVERQADWMAAYLTGAYQLPPGYIVEAERAGEYAAALRRFGGGAARAIAVDCGEYLGGLRGEMRRGALRADADGNPLPVPARAGRHFGEDAT